MHVNTVYAVRFQIFVDTVIKIPKKLIMKYKKYSQKYCNNKKLQKQSKFQNSFGWNDTVLGT